MTMPSPRRYDAVWMNIDWKCGSCQQHWFHSESLYAGRMLCLLRGRIPARCEKFVFSAGNTHVSSCTSSKFGVHTDIEAERKRWRQRERERDRGRYLPLLEMRGYFFGLMLGHERGSHFHLSLQNKASS